MEDSHRTSSGRVNTGRWTTVEHLAFIEGLRLHGREWRKVSTVVPTRTVVQIRTHAQKYYQKLAKEHGAELAERAFTSGLQLGVDMGTRVADSEVDAIFEQFPEAAAAAKRTEDVLPQLPRNHGAKKAAAAASGPAAGARAKAASSSSRRATKRRRPAPSAAAEAPLRTSARSGTRSRRAIAAAVAADRYADDYDDEEDDEGAALAREAREAGPAGCDGRYARDAGAMPAPPAGMPPRGPRRRAAQHGEAQGRLMLAGGPPLYARAPPAAASRSLPTTVDEAALMLLSSKTKGNYVNGKRTPRTMQSMSFLEQMEMGSALARRHAGFGDGVAAAAGRLPPRNPWGTAASTMGPPATVAHGMYAGEADMPAPAPEDDRGAAAAPDATQGIGGVSAALAGMTEPPLHGGPAGEEP